MGAQPGPCVAATRQCLSFGICLMVNEVRLKLSRLVIEANDLDPAHTDSTDAAIRGMQDETPARQPLIHVAGDDRHSLRIGLRDGFAFGHPSADEHIELLELGRPLTLVCLHTRSSFRTRACTVHCGFHDTSQMSVKILKLPTYPPP